MTSTPPSTNAAERDEVLREAPNILWLWRLARRDGITVSGPHGVVHALKQQFCKGLRHPDGAWRRVLRSGRAGFLPILRMRHISRRFDSVAQYADALVELGLPAPLPAPIVRERLQCCYLYFDRGIGLINASEFVNFRVSLSAAAHRWRALDAQGRRRLIRDEFHLVHDWMVFGAPRFSDSRWRASWPRLVARARAWSERRRAAAGGGWAFRAPMSACCGFELVALNTRLALWEEGAAMHNCLYALAPLCDEGRSRFFSLRKGRRRFATIELQYANHGWILRDVRGPMNRLPDPPVLRAAACLVQLAELVDIAEDDLAA